VKIITKQKPPPKVKARYVQLQASSELIEIFITNINNLMWLSGHRLKGQTKARVHCPILFRYLI